MKGKTLVVYYSWSADGNTRKLATLIQAATGADIFEVTPKQAYTQDYDTVVAQAKKEINEGYQPELQLTMDVTGYDTIFVGTPNWWSTMAPPMATFLTGQDFTGKTVVPFCSHGGGGWGRIPGDVAALCPGSETAEGFSAYAGGGSDMPEQVEAWLKNIGYIK